MRLITGDCLEEMKILEPVDAIVTDPPYGLAFMDANWDHGVPGVEYWKECLRVLKPGGYMLAFGGTRTFHRLICNIEDAGFEIRDCLMWIYGVGFPKSKACLKPAWEPVTLARKPGKKMLPLNIDTCRVGTDDIQVLIRENKSKGTHRFGHFPQKDCVVVGEKTHVGRYPPNVLLSHHESCTEESCHPDCVVKVLGEQSGRRKSKQSERGERYAVNVYEASKKRRVFAPNSVRGHDDEGTAARYFPQFRYCAKASKAERNRGLDTHEIIELALLDYQGGSSWENAAHVATLRVDTGQSVPRVIDGYGIPANGVSEWNTLLFGNGTTDSSQPECKFTISTASSSTTESRILNYLMLLHTSVYTQDANCETANGGSPVDIVESSTPYLIITFDTSALVHGVGSVASGTQLRISGNAKRAGNTHSTVKPVKLLEWLIKLVSKEGETVLDPFMGSGSTGVACANLKRKFVGIEINPEWVRIAEARINAPSHLPVPSV